MIKTTEQDKLTDHEIDRLHDFVAILTHDLQAPLASVKGLLKLVVSGRFDINNQHHRNLAGSAERAIMRAESIINDLLEAGRAESIGIAADLADYDLGVLLNDCIEMIKASANDYGVEIRPPQLSSAVCARVDKRLFLRVVDNLLFNALKNSPPGLPVEISVSPSGGRAIVSVSDRGSGFSENDASGLFEKYRQLELRRENKYRGTGIGLYFCRLAAEAMGGKIWAESRVGGGAIFHFAVKTAGRETCSSNPSLI